MSKQPQRILCIGPSGEGRSAVIAELLNDRGHKACALGIGHRRAIKAASALVDVVAVIDYPAELVPQAKRLLGADDAPITVVPLGKDNRRKTRLTELKAQICEYLDKCDWATDYSEGGPADG